MTAWTQEDRLHMSDRGIKEGKERMKWTITNFSYHDRANCHRDDGSLYNCPQPRGVKKGDTITLIREEIFAVKMVIIKVKRFGAVTVLRCREI